MTSTIAAIYNNNSLSAQQARTIEAVLHTLAVHLPEVNTLLDSSFSTISEQFVEVASLLGEYHDLTEKDARDTMYARISSLVSKTIIDMQFQDRVSQNLVIAVNITKQISEFLETQLKHGTPLDTEMTQKLVYLLNLGEIKQKFIQYAQEAGAMGDPAEYGIRDAVVEVKPNEDDIELF